MGKINARSKGNSYERQLVKEFKELFGKEDIFTSRSESKRMDDAGVDLVGVPMFNVQAKAWERAPSYHKVLSKMPDDTNYNLIFHKKNRCGEVVVMTKESFYEIIKMLKSEGVI